MRGPASAGLGVGVEREVLGMSPRLPAFSGWWYHSLRQETVGENQGSGKQHEFSLSCVVFREPLHYLSGEVKRQQATQAGVWRRGLGRRCACVIHQCLQVTEITARIRLWGERVGWEGQRLTSSTGG